LLKFLVINAQNLLVSNNTHTCIYVYNATSPKTGESHAYVTVYYMHISTAESKT